MDINKIMSLLPHRYPMLLVDRITEYKAYENISGYKNITVNEDVFNGHFPLNPIFIGSFKEGAFGNILVTLSLRYLFCMFAPQCRTFIFSGSIA